MTRLRKPRLHGKAAKFHVQYLFSRPGGGTASTLSFAAKREIQEEWRSEEKKVIDKKRLRSGIRSCCCCLEKRATITISIVGLDSKLVRQCECERHPAPERDSCGVAA